MEKENGGWTFTSDSCGYKIFCNGRFKYGGMTLGMATYTSDGKVKHWTVRRADVKMFHDIAKSECDRRNALHQNE